MKTKKEILYYEIALLINYDLYSLHKISFTTYKNAKIQLQNKIKNESAKIGLI